MKFLLEIKKPGKFPNERAIIDLRLRDQKINKKRGKAVHQKLPKNVDQKYDRKN